MTYSTILYDVTEGVATITLNRPQVLNALTDELGQELMDAFKRAGRDAAVRCLVLTGAGRGFCSGQDLGNMQQRTPGELISDHLRQGYNQLVTQMVTLEKPIIGAINGVAAGAGCGVALATDIRIVSEQASFMLAFSRVGLLPDSGVTWLLPRLVGYARAYMMAVSAEKIPAATALAWGMVNVVTPHDQLMEVTLAWARRLAAGPTRAFGLTKRAMHATWDKSFAEALEYEALLQDIAAGSRDFMEGVGAFLTKRPPDFRGQ